MKNAKKLFSLFLAVAMLLSMAGVGMTALAAESDSGSVRVDIVVPEVIYLRPRSTYFQYYIDGARNGATPSPTAFTQGSICFTCEKAMSSISIANSGAVVGLTQTEATNTTTFTRSSRAAQRMTAPGC